MCEPRDFVTPTEGGEEFDALVDRICAEAGAEADAKAGAEADAKAGAEADEQCRTPTGADTTDNAPLRAARVPPRLAIRIQHALVGRAKPIAKCARGLRF